MVIFIPFLTVVVDVIAKVCDLKFMFDVVGVAGLGDREDYGADERILWRRGSHL